jgi:hypothetical protein
VTFALILLGAIIWLVVGILLALNAHPAFPDDPLLRGVMAGLSIAAGSTIVVLLIFLARHRRTAYFRMLTALIAASLAIFFDDVGLIDALVLAIFMIPLVLLIRDRAWYLDA